MSIKQADSGFGTGTIGGDSGLGVASVTGDVIDNSDPLNPVVTTPAGAEPNNISDIDAAELTEGGETALHTHPNMPTQFAIFVTNGNATQTAVTGSPDVFSDAMVSSIAPVAPPYAGDFVSLGDGTASMIHEGQSESYKFSVSGTFNALNAGFFGTYVGIKLIGDLQGGFTGGTKYYPVGVSFGGGAQPIGFQISVYGLFQQNEIIRLQISSTVAGSVVLEDCIYTAERIQP